MHRACRPAGRAGSQTTARQDKQQQWRGTDGWPAVCQVDWLLLGPFRGYKPRDKAVQRRGGMRGGVRTGGLTCRPERDGLGNGAKGADGMSGKGQTTVIGRMKCRLRNEMRAECTAGKAGQQRAEALLPRGSSGRGDRWALSSPIGPERSKVGAAAWMQGSTGLVLPGCWAPGEWLGQLGCQWRWTMPGRRCWTQS